jgi:transcriptional regulator with XRE-family HTH domain
MKDEVKSRREALGWSFAKLAAEANVTEATVRNIEAGRYANPYTLKHVLRALNEGEAGARNSS